VFKLSRPSDDQIRSILDRQQSSPFSYAEVGASSLAGLPIGYHIDRYRIELGKGRTTFDAARIALRRLEMFDRSWLRVFPDNAEIRKGAAIAVVASHFGFYSINLCRIVYVIDCEGAIYEFGFAYGSLRQHAESGEERFTISWDRSDNTVWYEIAAFSKPRAFLARIAYPISRMTQRKFGRASLAAMMQAVRAAGAG
jgi:uncharacterized protein (UPF0548 family)